MSAYLDKSQGVTFVYSNIFQLYRQAKEARLDAPFVAPRPVAPKTQPRVLKDTDAKVETYQPKELNSGEARTFPVPMGVREAEEKAKRQAAHPVASLQKNLSELTDAHEKLRFLLKELEALTKKK